MSMEFIASVAVNTMERFRCVSTRLPSVYFVSRRCAGTCEVEGEEEMEREIGGKHKVHHATTSHRVNLALPQPIVSMNKSLKL